MQNQIEEITTQAGVKLKRVPQNDPTGSSKYFVNDQEVEYWSYRLLPESRLETLTIKFKELNSDGSPKQKT